MRSFSVRNPHWEATIAVITVVLIIQVAYKTVQIVVDLYNDQLLCAWFDIGALLIIATGIFIALNGGWRGTVWLNGVVTFVLAALRVLLLTRYAQASVPWTGTMHYFMIQSFYIIAIGALSYSLVPILTINTITLACSALFTYVATPNAPISAYVTSVAVYWFAAVLVGLMLYLMRRRLIALIARQNAFLRETHHRAKNQIAMLSSLITLQPDEVEAPVLRYSLLARLTAMAEIQEELQAAETYGEIDLGSFIQRLVEKTLAIIASPALQLSSHIEVQPHPISGRCATQVGMLLIELIINSAQHAFPNRSDGTITIRLTHHKQETRLFYRDDGCGLPPTVTPSEPISVGLILVQDLATSLGGTLHFENDQGMTCTLSVRHTMAPVSPSFHEQAGVYQ